MRPLFKFFAREKAPAVAHHKTRIGGRKTKVRIGREMSLWPTEICNGPIVCNGPIECASQKPCLA